MCCVYYTVCVVDSSDGASSNTTTTAGATAAVLSEGESLQKLWIIFRQRARCVCVYGVSFILSLTVMCVIVD